jgi:hypothetical protein
MNACYSTENLSSTAKSFIGWATGLPMLIEKKALVVM